MILCALFALVHWWFISQIVMCLNSSNVIVNVVIVGIKLFIWVIVGIKLFIWVIVGITLFILDSYTVLMMIVMICYCYYS